MDEQDIIDAVMDADAESAFPGFTAGSTALAAAHISTALAAIDCSPAEVVAFARDIASAIAGASSEISHEIAGAHVTVEVDGDLFQVIIDGEIEGEFEFDGDEAVAL